jgi:hypothetical protein
MIRARFDYDAAQHSGGQQCRPPDPEGVQFPVFQENPGKILFLAAIRARYLFLVRTLRLLPRSDSRVFFPAETGKPPR